MFGFEGCFDNSLAHKPPAEVWKDVRNKGGQGKQTENVLTLENDGSIWAPEVAKTSRVLIGRKISKTLPISEDIELVRMPKVLSRLHRKSTTICLRRHGKMGIEVWILFESNTPFVFETAEVPQDLCQARIFIEHLWRLNQFLGAGSMSRSSRAHVSR